MNKSYLIGSICLIFLSCTGCNPKSGSAKPSPKVLEDLASARKHFTTELRVQGPSPQDYPDDQPPPGVNEVEYPSGNLKLKGWLSENAMGSQKGSAVVFLHGGWAFYGSGTWEELNIFTNDGFVVFTPMLRGENGNPGVFESFLGEVDDVIAAVAYVSTLPGVDGTRVYLAGHSVGGVLTCLTSMQPSGIRAAAALDGFLNMDLWVDRGGAPSPDYIPYDLKDRQEIRMRNPMAFVHSIQCPLRIICGDATKRADAPFVADAKSAGKDCEMIVVSGDHMAMALPAVKQATKWFRQLEAGPSPAKSH